MSDPENREYHERIVIRGALVCNVIALEIDEGVTALVEIDTRGNRDYYLQNVHTSTFIPLDRAYRERAKSRIDRLGVGSLTINDFSLVQDYINCIEGCDYERISMMLHDALRLLKEEKVLGQER